MPGPLFNKELVNAPLELLYTRRKLFEKIMQNLARRKIQNSMQATGDRMAATPEQFGKNLAKNMGQLGGQMGKQAALPEGLFAGLGGAMTGGATGLGVGALYGLLSGALQARKGKRLRGALGGALRGAGGGGLIGAGIGGGLGLGSGLMMPNVFTSNPLQQAATSMSIAANPISHAAKMTLGATAGGIGGGYLGNKARKKLIGDKAESEEEEENEGLETEDKTEISPALKAAGLVPSFQQAAREGLAGMRGRFKILENMRGVGDRLLSGDLYPMPSVSKHINIVNRGTGHAADIGAKLERMLKHMRVPADKIKETVGGAPLTRSGVPPRQMPPEQLRDLYLDAFGR